MPTPCLCVQIRPFPQERGKKERRMLRSSLWDFQKKRGSCVRGSGKKEKKGGQWVGQQIRTREKKKKEDRLKTEGKGGPPTNECFSMGFGEGKGNRNGDISQLCKKKKKKGKKREGHVGSRPHGELDQGRGKGKCPAKM